MRRMWIDFGVLYRACARVLPLLAAAGLWGGCSAPIHRSAEPAFFHAGRAVEQRPDATFFPADPSVLDVTDPDIASRAQARMAYRPEATLFDQDAWQPAPRPSLSSRRYLNIPDRPTTYIYYETPRGSRGSNHHRFDPVPVFDPRR